MVQTGGRKEEEKKGRKDLTRGGTVGRGKEKRREREEEET